MNTCAAIEPYDPMRITVVATSASEWTAASTEAPLAGARSHIYGSIPGESVNGDIVTPA